MEFAFHWYDIFLTAWFVLTLSMSKIKNYRHALIVNIAATLALTVYGLCIQEYVAASTTAIAAASGMVQLFIPISNERKYVIARNAIAVVMAVLACVLLYEKPADIFPCIGAFLTRVGEAQQSARIMKMAIIGAAGTWVVFSIMAGLYLLLAMEIVIISVLTYKLFKDGRNAHA